MSDVEPDYYTRWDIEPIDAIEAWGLNFNIGNVVKYVVRCGHKGSETALLDLQKAHYYLRREHDRLAATLELDVEKEQQAVKYQYTSGGESEPCEG